MPAMQTPLNGADTAWVMVSTALVLLMTPALGFFYGGLVRSKNVLNTMMMSMAAIGVVGLVWMLLGYSLAFSPGSPLVGGTGHAFLRDVALEPGKWGAFPHLLYASYQGTFAIIAAALISGAVVERMRFGAYLAFLALWSLFVYAPVAHWVWGDGWIARMGAIDFAGGTVVHVNAGVAALVAAMTVGQRSDYGRHAVLPHNVPFVLLGAALLWFGWFGFNAGSALSANATAALAFTNTLIAPMATLVVWLLLDLQRSGKATAVGAATAIVIGLVAITPAAGYVGPLSAIALGAIAAVPSYIALQIRSRSALDDSLDVFAAHGIGGIVGAMLTGVFAAKLWSAPVDGLLAGGGGLVGHQLVALLATAAYSGVMTYVILRAVALVLPLRRPSTQERLGLDVLQHGEEAYSHGDGALLVMRERRAVPRTPGDGKP
jgi:Amt family ammonium transporter